MANPSPEVVETTHGIRYVDVDAGSAHSGPVVANGDDTPDDPFTLLRSLAESKRLAVEAAGAVTGQPDRIIVDDRRVLRWVVKEG